MADWLKYSQAAVAKVRALGIASEAERLAALIEQNVLLQLQHLRTHPSVLPRLDAGEVRLHGWVYDIKTGAVKTYDALQGGFVAMEDPPLGALGEV